MTVTVVDTAVTFRPHDSVRRDAGRGVLVSAGWLVPSSAVALPVGAERGEGHTGQTAPGVPGCMVGWVSLTSALSVDVLLARVGVGLVGVECLVEGFDGVAVQAGPDVGVHVGGDVQPGVTE